MEETKVNDKPTEKKLSYEELGNVCHQLQEQNRKMYQQIQMIQMGNMFKRLDYLFEVVKISDKFDSEFVIDCIDEIKEALKIKEAPEKKEEVKEEK